MWIHSTYTLQVFVLDTCSRYMRRNGLCCGTCFVTLWFRRNAWKPAVRLFLRVDRPSDHHIEWQKSRLMQVQKSTRAGCSRYMRRNALCCDTCVERFGLVEMYGSLLCCCFLGWDGSVSNCGKVADATPGNNTCGGVFVSLFFGFEWVVSYRSPEQVRYSRVPNTPRAHVKVVSSKHSLNC